MLRGLVPGFPLEIFRPLSEPEKPHCWPGFLLPRSHFIPPHTPLSRQIKPSVCVPIGSSNSIVTRIQLFQGPPRLADENVIFSSSREKIRPPHRMMGADN